MTKKDGEKRDHTAELTKDMEKSEILNASFMLFFHHWGAGLVQPGEESFRGT